MLLHDAVGDGEAEAGALVLAGGRLDLGGEKGVVDAVEVFALDACAGVGDGDDDFSGAEGVFERRCDAEGGVWECRAWRPWR